MPIIKINGANIHYAVEGRGPSLLLVSGLGAHGGAWAPVVPKLSGDFKCITFDARGTGRSDVTEGPYSIDSLADDACALIRTLGAAPSHVVGWSLGGSVLQSMLIRHADVISRAVLLNAFPSYTSVQHAWLDALVALRASGADRLTIAAFGLPWGLTPRSMGDHSVALALAAAAADDPYPTSNPGFLAQADGLRRYDSRQHLSSVTRPTLVLAGAEDVLTPVAQSVEIAKLIPGAELMVLPRGGHRMIHEYLDDTVGAIRRFLCAKQA